MAAKLVYEAGGVQHCWDPGMIQALSPEMRAWVVQHERLHLEMAKDKMTLGAYDKALAELKKLEDGTWS